MNRSKPSTVLGGGEMKRDTSSVVSSAKSDGRIRRAQLAQHDLPAAQRRQPVLPVGADDRLGASDVTTACCSSSR